jgi:alpha-glucosidase
MCPVFFADPKDADLRAEEQAFLLGSDLLVIPPWAENPALPKGIWENVSLVDGDVAKFQARLKIRGGSIIPAGKIIQHTGENSLDPLTLLVCLDEQGSAAGELYWDGGDGFQYESGDFGRWRFTAQRDGEKVMVKLDKSAGRHALPSNANIEVITRDGVRRGSGSLKSGVTISL